MSRRPPNPAAERAAQNQATIKSLLKLEPNKICADCKRNKHPRWASWNLGVFVCIRCSGIHRGMGTHISRVKSVDLDSWTDEQMQSILSWGNARANKYWEAKLAAGHVPSEAKIENFIRTKYELKRWVMDGPIPDPATLDEGGDDDLPLSVVREKATIERKESLRKQEGGQSSAAAAGGRRAAPPPQADLIGGDPIPQRASTTEPPAASRVPPKAEAAPPRTTAAAKDSLLGLDFFGEQTAAPPRPSSTSAAGGATGAQSRPDLKQSILSLYATAPRPQAPPQSPPATTGSFGGFGQQPQSQAGGLVDAFGGLSFSNTSSAAPATAPDPFGSLASPAPKAQPPTTSTAFGGLGSGGFFSAKPTPPASAPSHQKQPSNSGFGGLGSFGSPAAPAAAAPASSAMGDLFDFSSPASTVPAVRSSPAPAASSVFNLSSQPKAPAAPATTTTASSLGGAGNWSSSDVWGSNEWSTPDVSAPAAPAARSPDLSRTSTVGGGTGANDFGWGSSAAGGFGGSGPSSGLASQSIVPGASGGFAPKVAADEEFGGWTSSQGPASAGGGNTKSAAGFGASEDLFSNVWQ